MACIDSIYILRIHCSCTHNAPNATGTATVSTDLSSCTQCTMNALVFLRVFDRRLCVFWRLRRSPQLVCKSYVSHLSQVPLYASRSRSSLRVVFFSPFFFVLFCLFHHFFSSSFVSFHFCCVKIRIWICAIVSCRCHCLVALVSLIKPVSSARRSPLFFVSLVLSLVVCCKYFRPSQMWAHTREMHFAGDTIRDGLLNDEPRYIYCRSTPPRY